jgi:hypothetical protein
MRWKLQVLNDKVRYGSNKLTISKFILASSVLFSTLAMIVAFQNPINGYELSIYSATPKIVWLSLIISISGSLFIVIYQIYSNQYKLNNLWLLGLLILLYNRVIILYIPYIRGIYSWRGDNLSHIGALIDILKNGYVPETNFYPITHILLTQMHHIGNIELEYIVNYSTGLFSICYVIGIYLLSTAIFSSKKAQILSTCSAVVVFFAYNVYLMPNGWSQLYLPFAIFLFLKTLAYENIFQYKILFLIILFLYPFFHPITSLYIILCMGIAIIVMIYSTFSIKKMRIENSIFISNKPHRILKRIALLIYNKKKDIPIYYLILEVVIFSYWVLLFGFFHANIRNMYYSVMRGTSNSSGIGSMQNTLDKIGITGTDFIELLVKMEGANILFIGLFIFSLIICIKRKDVLQKNLHLILLTTITGITAFIYATYLFGIIPGLENINAERLKTYITIFTPVFAGFVFLYLTMPKRKYHKSMYFLIGIIVFTASMLSIFSLYNSPYIMQPTPSVTQMDMKGAEWFTNYHKEGTLTVHIISPIPRFADAIMGQSERRDTLGFSRSIHKNVPNHFNYSVNNRLGKTYIDDKYMIITMFDRSIYDSVWKAIGRFDGHDFKVLNNDSTVIRIYSNGQSNLYHISGIQLNKKQKTTY